MIFNRKLGGYYAIRSKTTGVFQPSRACLDKPSSVISSRKDRAHTNPLLCFFHPNAWVACAGYQAEPTMNDTALAIPYALKVRNTPLLAPFIYKMHLLPRQARDKHRESTQKRGRPFFLQTRKETLKRMAAVRSNTAHSLSGKLRNAVHCCCCCAV